MKRWRRGLWGLWVLLVCAGSGHAQPESAPAALQHNAAPDAAAGAAQERARIQQERQAIDRALQQAQTACYQRFAVEDCLQKARRTARQADASLRQRETALAAAERRERAAQRLATIAEHQKSPPAPVPSVSAVPGAAPLGPANPGRQVQARVPQPTEKDTAQQSRERQAQARVRARQQQQKSTAHQAGQAEAMAAHAANAAKARQLQEEKRAAAAKRKARVLQSQADNAAAGRKPAAPLSPDP